MLPSWLLPMNGLQDGKPYAGRPVCNSPEFMPLDNSLNRDILHSDLLKLCLKKKHNITEFIYDTTVFNDYKTRAAR